MSEVQAVAEELWVAQRPFAVGGLHVGVQMTIIRLDDGTLFLHSPIQPDDALCAEVDELGPVGHLVAPNAFHHLFIGAWHERYPEARLYAAPGLEKKRKDLAFDTLLGNVAEPAWSGLIDQHVYGGAPKYAEVVFFHRASRTLVLTDMAFNIERGKTWLTRLYLKLSKAHGRFGQTFLVRLLTKDRAAARSSVERILTWPFDRVLVCHGEVLESGGREAFARIFEWLPAAETAPSEPEVAG